MTKFLDRAVWCLDALDAHRHRAIDDCLERDLDELFIGGERRARLAGLSGIERAVERRYAGLSEVVSASATQ